MASGANDPTPGAGTATRSPSPLALHATKPGPHARRTDAEKVAARRALAHFDRLRDLASDPDLSDDHAEKINDGAWAIVEEADPIRVAHAAKLLGVTGPTVRNWISHGLIEPVEDTSPLRVTLDSVAEVKEVADELRELNDRGPRLVSAVIGRLEGEALASSARFRQSLEQMRRGERGKWPGD